MSVVGATAAIGAAAKKGFGWLGAREERKRGESEARARVDVARANGDTDVTLQTEALNHIFAKNTGQSWKDEFVVLVIFAPLIILILGALAQAFGMPHLFVAGVNVLKVFSLIGINYGLLLLVVTLTSVGLRALKDGAIGPALIGFGGAGAAAGFSMHNSSPPSDALAVVDGFNLLALASASASL